MPLVNAIGINPVHLGVVIVLNLMIGLSTPPVGMSLFVSSKIANVPLEKLYKEIMPFLIPLIGVLLIITYFPGNCFMAAEDSPGILIKKGRLFYSGIN